MPEISVIVPVYRAEAFLEDCLSSILKQTFSDFEILAVDDGSPDGSAEICRRYAQMDSRVRLLRQENAGQSAARNHGLREAKGRWICFVDSDDAIHPQMLELLYRAATENGCPISQCRMLESPEYPENFDGPRQGACTVLPMDEETIAALLDRDEYPGWVSCAKLIRRELIEGYPFREGRVYEDNEAVCRWIVAAGKIADIPDKMYYYRTNPDSTTKSSFSRKKLDYLWALESILVFYSELGWPQVRNRFLDRYVHASADHYLQAKRTPGLEREAGRMERSTVRFLIRQRLSLTGEQIVVLLDAMHPRLLCVFWKLCGLARTAKQEGFSALIKKVRKLLGGKSV